MEIERIRHILEEVRKKTTPVEEAMEQLRDLPYEDLGFAKIDHHRTLRTGFPEVIYCPGKTNDQIAAIADRLRQRSSKVLATRATPEMASILLGAYPSAVYHESARIVCIPGPDEPQSPQPDAASRSILVVAA